jgi:hypothetical protein
MMPLELSLSDGASLTVIISIMLLELSILLLENIYSAGITHGNHHMRMQGQSFIQLCLLLMFPGTSSRAERLVNPKPCHLRLDYLTS